MVKCCVNGCRINSKDVSFHKFPKNRKLKRKWLNAVITISKVNGNSLVCSQHFTNHDFENLRGKKRLKAEVVPSVSCGKSDVDEENLLKSVTEENDRPSSVDSEICRTTTNSVDNGGNSADNEASDSKTESVYNNGMEVERVEVVPPVEKAAEDNCVVSHKSVTEEKENSVVIIEPEKQDIEDIITNYQIKQNKLLHKSDAVVDIELGDPKPVVEPAKYVELPYCDKVNGNPDSPEDCVMLLENVQVDIDPDSLILPEPDYEVDLTEKKESINLLTSSDDDDVIIQEPKIDIVVVSDEDEDDLPLAKIAKLKKDKFNPKMLWGLYEYFCMRCHFRTTSCTEYKRHTSEHSVAIQICEVCRYTTSSKSQFIRHKRKHRNEKVFQCHLCEYKARHRMSLLYHLKSHTTDSLNKSYKCHQCPFRSKNNRAIMKHLTDCVRIFASDSDSDH